MIETSPLEWGTLAGLTPLDTLMWRADTNRSMRSTVMAVEILDTAPDWERLVDAHEWASRMVPRLRDRVTEPFGFIGRPVWAPDEGFDLRFHVRRLRLAGESGWAELLTLAAQLAM